MSNLQIIQELYRAFREKDDDAFREICSPDLEWVQNEGFPGGATYRGAQAVIDGVFKAFNQDWDTWRFQTEDYLDAGSSIVVTGFYQGIHRVSQKSFCAQAAHIYELAEGKVVKFRQFTDTKVIWDAMS